MKRSMLIIIALLLLIPLLLVGFLLFGRSGKTQEEKSPTVMKNTEAVAKKDITTPAAPKQEETAVSTTKRAGANDTELEKTDAKTPDDKNQPGAATVSVSKKIPDDRFEFLTEFGGGKYYLSKTAASWYDADIICRGYGGHLVTITSAAENNAIIKSLKAKKAGGSIWIGATMKAADFFWVTGEASHFSNWQLTKPDFTSGETSKHADHVRLMTFLSFTWDDWAGSTEILYILEINN